jgi:hypothetical protein
MSRDAYLNGILNRKKKPICVMHKIINQKFTREEAFFFLSNTDYKDKICPSCKRVLEKILLGSLADAP